MRLFGRWRSISNNDSKRSISELGSNKKKYSKPAIGQKHALFDGIIRQINVYEFTYKIRGHNAVGGNSTKFGIVDYSFLLVMISYKTQLCYLVQVEGIYYVLQTSITPRQV